MVVIRGLKIIEGANGTFIAMPSRQRKDGSYQDVAHPINRPAREWMETAVIRAYKQEVQRSQETGYTGPSSDDEEAAEDAY